MTEHFFKTLKIENFRGIKSLEINDLARVNLFVGENNCGKTTVLEAGFLLAGIADPGWMIWLNNNRGMPVRDDSDIRNFFYGRNHDKSVSLACAQGKGGRELNVSAVYGNLSALQTKDALSTQNGGMSHTFRLNPSNGRSMVGIKYNYAVAGKIAGDRSSHEAKIYWTDPGRSQLKSELDASDERVMRYFYCSKSGYNSDFVDEMLNKKQKVALLRILKSIDPAVQDIKSGTQGLISVDIGLDSFVPINIMGGGVIRILNMLSSVNWAADGVVMIDEVEDGLHVNALKKVWELILTHSAQTNTQIFLTTHSGDVIKSLRNALDSRLFSDAVACYRLVKFPDDVVRAYRYSGEQLGMALDSDTDIRV